MWWSDSELRTLKPLEEWANIETIWSPGLIMFRRICGANDVWLEYTWIQNQYFKLKKSLIRNWEFTIGFFSFIYSRLIDIWHILLLCFLFWTLFPFEWTYLPMNFFNWRPDVPEVSEVSCHLTLTPRGAISQICFICAPLQINSINRSSGVTCVPD